MVNVGTDMFSLFRLSKDSMCSEKERWQRRILHDKYSHLVESGSGVLMARLTCLTEL